MFAAALCAVEVTVLCGSLARFSGQRLDAFSGDAEYSMQSFSGLVMVARILEQRRLGAAQMAYLSQPRDLLVQHHTASFKLHFC